MQKPGIAEADIEFYRGKCNCLANLQLLEGTLNLEKSGMDCKKWLDRMDEKARTAYKERHYIPDVDLSLGNFREFIEKREQLLFSKLKELLA